MLDSYRGVKLTTILQAIESKYQIKLKDDFIPTYRSIVYDLFEEQLEPCEGIEDALSEINLPICVASSGPPEKINKSLSKTGLLKHFGENIFSSFEIDSWKPEPDLFLHAAKKMGFQANECAVIEDSIVGITAAKSAGMCPILYDPHAIHDPSLCSKIITHMRELPSLIN